MDIPPGPCTWTWWNLHPPPGCYFSTCIRSGLHEESGVPESAVQMVSLDLSICQTALAKAVVSQMEDMLAVRVCPHLSCEVWIQLWEHFAPVFFLWKAFGALSQGFLLHGGMWKISSPNRRSADHQSGRNQAGI